MYLPQRRRPWWAVLVLMLVGVVGGTAYYAWDNLRVVVPPLPTATATARATVPAPPVTPIGTPAATPTLPYDMPLTGAALTIPTIGVTTQIIEAFLNGESWDITGLGTNAGHLQGTGWFGQPGNIVLSGHVELADGRQGIFARLSEVEVGQPVLLSQPNDERRYVVTRIFTTNPADMTVLYPTPTDTLTLITCSAYNFVQNVYEERLVVVAERAG